MPKIIRILSKDNLIFKFTRLKLYFDTALNKYVGECERQQEMDSFTGRSIIMDNGQFKDKNVLMMDLFLTNTQLFS